MSPPAMSQLPTQDSSAFPPAYESVVGNDDGDTKPPHGNKPGQAAQPIAQQPLAVQGPMSTAVAGPSNAAAPVHYYQNPWTGEQVASFLPPDHPEMVCLQEGRHITKNTFGIVGVLAAVFWFPLGIALCMLDRHLKCTRCGRILEDGVTCSFTPCQ